ncbi:unnamed protein product [Pieris macdunnoughi]|uniref:Uncharacterized protein n=1 Tax=Pieris macdunnoughi TaxID=345717 RepID=A0A821V875_9NEOP|nr:unnamed protein product [Pieris macdunnoughi]
MPDREVPGSGFLPLQFPSAFAAFHATAAQAPPGTMHHATHYHHHAHLSINGGFVKRTGVNQCWEVY